MAMGIRAGRYASSEGLPADTRAACDALVPPGTAVADLHSSANWMKMILV
jgi:hypothetical protein